jgi:polyisoprenoid-binding protein YceI
MFLVAAVPALAQNGPPPGGPPPGGPPPGGPPMPMGPPPVSSQNLTDAPSGVYQTDRRHVSVIIRILHQGLSQYALRLNSANATLNFNSTKPEASKVEAAIEAASLDVGDPSISQEFAQKFLDAANNPKITFISTEIKNLGHNKFAMTGDLKLHGVTKPVTLQVWFNGTRPDMGPDPGKRVGFSATGTVKRSDFGIAGGMPSSMLGEDLSVDIEAEFVQKK